MLNRLSVRPTVGATFAVLCAPLASAQVQTTFSIATQSGNSVAGVGLVTNIDTVAVANGGVWIVEADTDNSDLNADSVVLRNGALVSRQGDALAAPAGTTISSFGSGGARISSAGNWAWNYFLDGATSGADSGIFFDNTLVLQEGTISLAPQFSVGTPYIGFFGAKINDASQALVVATVEDVAIASTVDRALVRFQLGPGGALLSETVIAKEGDVLPGQTEAVADFATGPHGSDFNDLGQVLFIADLAGSTASDGAIYLDSTLLAQEGAPSPVAGRNWLGLSTSQRVALNNVGDYAFTGQLDAPTTDDIVLVRNGAVFMREGDLAPGVSGGWTVTSFGSGAVDLDDAGNMYWFCDWTDPDITRDTGIYRNNQLLVQEGVSVINGQLLTSIATVQENFMVSADGRWLIFEGGFAGGASAAILIEMSGATSSYCTSSTTTNGCNPSIAGIGAPSASLATPFTIAVSNVEGQRLGLVFYGVSGPLATPWSATSTSFLCVKTPTQRTLAQSTGGTNAQCNGALTLNWNAFISFNPSALGAPFSSGDTLWAQGWFRDPPAPKTTNLSDGLAVVFQP